MTISNLRFQISNSALVLFLLLVVCISLDAPAVFAAKWGGVDESVIEKYADEHGRAARDPVINTDQGDLLLFVFLIAGATGGFAAGYYWRQLTESKKKGNSNKGKVKVVQGSSK